DLTTLRDNIQNLIDENEVNSNNISSYLSNQIYDLVKNINIVENGSLEQYVVEPTYSSDSINISLKSDVGYYKFKTSSFTNVSITSNQISLNNITLYSPPTPSPDNWFKWDGTTIKGLTSLGSNQSKIVIPARATSLSNGSFSNNKNIVSVDMSFSKVSNLLDSTTFNTGVFAGCVNLEKVIFSKSLENIGNFSFSNCSKLTNIKLPSNWIKNIGNYSFYNCINLVEFTMVNWSNDTFFGGYVFSGCINLSSLSLTLGTKLSGKYIFQNTPKLKSIAIPERMTNIVANSFANASGLETITIPPSITSISSFAFYSCTNLKNVNMVSLNLKSIGNSAFEGCDKLEIVTLGDGINAISSDAFKVNNNYIIIYVPSDYIKNLLTKSGFNGSIVIN
ncbi:MAG: leucine-rich repeat domain-containing protein, partial [Ureaplasma sp.]|nr:leucine-rich repeat domain-containing protein [Ureaplasma sp.]